MFPLFLKRWGPFGTLCIFIILASCGETNLGSGVSISSGTSPTNNEDPVDTTPPTLNGSITVSNDSGTDRTGTAVWSQATDDTQVSYYELRVSEDEGSGACDASDFSTPLLDWFKVPLDSDFSGSGYQVLNGALDGNGQSLSLSLKGDQNYCLSVRATDSSGNVSDIIYNSSPFSFLYSSCLSAKNNESGLSDGVYTIDPDGASGVPGFDVFCDMTTQGGGWTLVMRYDAAEADAVNFFMPTGSGQNFLNVSDLQSLNNTGNLTASANMVPFIENGATMLMHVGKPNDGATDSTTYARVYFSEIYQVVIDNPTNIFNNAFDTNSGDGVSGVVVAGTSAARKDRWFEADMTVMTIFDTDGDATNTHRIVGGEGDAMFNNGDREGALYCSAATSTGTGHGDPKVQWGFAGKDGSGQGYGGTIYVGTHCKNDLTCGPENNINLMFIR